MENSEKGCSILLHGFENKFKQEKKHKWRTLNGEIWYKGTKISYTTNNNKTSLHTPLAYGKKKGNFFSFFLNSTLENLIKKT